MIDLTSFQKINSLKEIKTHKGTSRALIEYALNNKIEVYRIFKKRLIFCLKRDDKIVWINRALTSEANPVGINIAKDKNLAKQFIFQLGFPVSLSKVVEDESELEEALKKIKFPLVVKPLGSEGGKGITVNIENKELLIDSFHIAKKYDKKVLIEKYALGDYYRITYVADGSYAAIKNMPAFIIGNGNDTAENLIKKENNFNIDRRKEGRLKKIKISEKAERFLKSKNYVLGSVIPVNEKIPLCFGGFDGGEYIDVTEKVATYYLQLSKKIADFLGLPIVGIDILAENIEEPLDINGGIVVEINGSFPDIDIHYKPTIGESRNLAPNLIEYLFSQV
jgi:cyanophycin synthetase